MFYIDNVSFLPTDEELEKIRNDPEINREWCIKCWGGMCHNPQETPVPCKRLDRKPCNSRVWLS